MSFEEHQVKRRRLSENGSELKQQEDFSSHEPPHERPDRENKFSREREMADQPNKVLLFTVVNAVYPITTDVLHMICEPCGEVQRIVIFRKRGVQAMIEFGSIQDAQRAKASLNGADIYSGCCTLKIEWAKPARLNVYKNDDETWDYTGAVDEPNMPMQQPALLGDAPAGFSNPPPYRTGQRMPVPAQRGRGGMRGRPPVLHARPRRPNPPLMNTNVHQMPNEYMGEDYGPPMDGNTTVLMVYGLNPEKMTCDRVFNILCLYGNVMKVKFLKSKPGTAMVQMGDPSAVGRAISNLSGMKFFDEKLVLAPSKQLYLTDTGPVGDLPNGTPAQVDFGNSRNNRFQTNEQAAKNRIQNPAKVLHYYNAPLELNEEKMKEICQEFDLALPVKFTPFKTRSERSSSGLMEFDTKAQAMEVLTYINHYKLDNPAGRFPYILKLCFSTASTATRD
uniref:heterogeneous nuclear ribonucleoprotein L-like isoform X1 n=2 Tax=Ciona intestinalis TaxID=7719 RepID=UPI0000524DBC|nr:heterogeneous nuclear ribonucleoprotein L-like isoform X1 [Ciona intestinalis]|eukprot:XP_026692528.1 heterogeneous nuclear ribonucleoprotein L-like isoform X1 [Ciona intestinalis]